MSDDSPLHPQQKEALWKLKKWFSESNKVDGEKTKDYTAVVKMPTGTGKTGVMCCLPYYLAGADLNPFTGGFLGDFFNFYSPLLCCC
jgi:hypothetical protein